MNNLTKSTALFLLANTIFSMHAFATNSLPNDYAVTATSPLLLNDPHADNTQTVVYVWPNPQIKNVVSSKEQTLESNEYWQEVTGAQLMSGLPIYTTSTKAFIRIAPKARYSEGEVFQSEPLNARFIKIRSDMPQSQFQAIEQTVSQQEMSLAGFDDGSIALTTNAQQGAGRLMIQSQQGLAINATYLIHIKEKHSPHRLQVTADNTFEANSQGLKLSGHLLGQRLDEAQTVVNLIGPDGIKTPTRLQKGRVVLPTDLANVGAYQGFYELEVTTEKLLAGLTVKRSIKVPFAQVIKTAQLESVTTLLSEENPISMPIKVMHPGRYAVTATLAQLSSSGQVKYLQTIEVARWLKEDGLFELPFTIDREKQHTGKIFLANVKLVDQSRMMLLEHHARF